MSLSNLSNKKILELVNYCRMMEDHNPPLTGKITIIRRGDKRYNNLVKQWSMQMFESGQGRSGNDFDDIKNTITAQLDFIVCAKDITKKGAEYFDGKSNPLGFIAIQVGANITDRALGDLISHEMVHTYSGRSGYGFYLMGPLIFYNPKADCNRGNDTISRKESYSLHDFLTDINSSFSYERDYRRVGLSALNESLANLINYRRGGNPRPIHDSDVTANPLTTSNWIELFVGELLENSFGKEKLKDMFYDGSVKFQFEYDKKCGQGMYVNLLFQMGRNFERHSLSTAINLIDYVLSNVPDSMVLPKSEHYKRILDIHKVACERTGCELGEEYHKMVKSLNDFIESNPLEQEEIEIFRKSVRENPPKGIGSNSLKESQIKFNNICKNLFKRQVGSIWKNFIPNCFR